MDNQSNLRSPKPFVVVVTPIKNEATIVGRFLACCSMFADRIVLLDQNSVDHTLSIAREFPKVEIYSNLDPSFGEQSRQRRLLEIARETNPGRLVILTLDADEIPTANILTSLEWISAINSNPGTVILMPRLEILPGFHHVLVHDKWPFGFVDDGSVHSGAFIHSVRVPMPTKRAELVTSRVGVMHYSFVRPQLQAAKNRFYCIKENLSASRKLMERRALYRYDFIENCNRTMKRATFDNDWIASYTAQGIDMTGVVEQHPNWFDVEVESEMVRSGGVRFHFDPVWNHSYECPVIKDKPFYLPPRGLVRCLALVDRFYAACPFKRIFAQFMEAASRAYSFCRR